MGRVGRQLATARVNTIARTVGSSSKFWFTAADDNQFEKSRNSKDHKVYNSFLRFVFLHICFPF